jgi:hypothetical protein
MKNVFKNKKMLVGGCLLLTAFSLLLVWQKKYSDTEKPLPPSSKITRVITHPM